MLSPLLSGLADEQQLTSLGGGAVGEVRVEVSIMLIMVQHY